MRRPSAWTIPSRFSFRPGKIGYEALKSFVITLDSRNRRVRFAR